MGEIKEKTFEFICGEQEINKVAIYGNAAEVTRKLHVKFESGENIVIIKVRGKC